jgi:hypothetical protein
LRTRLGEPALHEQDVEPLLHRPSVVGRRQPVIG